MTILQKPPQSGAGHAAKGWLETLACTGLSVMVEMRVNVVTDE